MSVRDATTRPAIDRSRVVLPLPDVRPVGLTTYDARDPDTSFPPIRKERPPAGAPNVLLMLLDDVGFGAASAFGGPVATPTAERLAAGGLRYTRFRIDGEGDSHDHLIDPAQLMRFAVSRQ